MMDWECLKQDDRRERRLIDERDDDRDREVELPRDDDPERAIYCSSCVPDGEIKVSCLRR